MKKISLNITYAEATKSQTAIRLGIDNTPTEQQLNNMRVISEAIFEPVRLALGGNPIFVNSFFRSPKLNTAIGGSPNSQHCEGKAMDLDSLDDTKNKEIFEYIKNHLVFDQLIWEFGDDNAPAWVHVSFSSRNNRRQILKAKKIGDITRYEPFSR